MAMTKCKECNNEISTKAKKCPHCGAPVKKKNTLGLILLAVIGIPLVLTLITPPDDKPRPAPTTSQTKESQRRIAEAKAKGDALLAEYESDKAVIIADAKVMLAEGRYSEVTEKYDKYRIARDADLDALLASAVSEANRQNDPEREAKLLAQLKEIPGSSTSANLVRYQELSRLYPDTPKYGEKVNFYLDQRAAQERERQAKAAADKALKERIQKQFSPWDGSHRLLERTVKANLKDPDSYEHIETRYGVDGETLTIVMKYRAKNSFGGYTLGQAVAKTDLDGSYLKIISSE